jgi:SET domain-containing protein
MLVLRPSAISGVGVFTTAPIVKGEHLRLWQEEDWRFVSRAEAETDPEVRELRDTYCVTDASGYWCPLDFHRMSIGWYMNHSDQPNVSTSRELNYEYYAVRDIEAGEEIVCDYSRITPYESAPAGASGA